MSRVCPALSVAVTSELSFPWVGRVVLAAELGQSTADADTMLGFPERYHNRCATAGSACPGAAADKSRRYTETGRPRLKRIVPEHLSDVNVLATRIDGVNSLFLSHSKATSAVG